jgi:tetratricopeptide (TPR) repeat protein
VNPDENRSATRYGSWESMRNLLVALLMCLSAAARADDTAEAKRQSRAHFRAGAAFYEAGAYDRAISEYKEAYRLFALPGLLFNLGQAHRQKGETQEAIAYYQRYLEASPAGEASDLARQLLRELTTPPTPATAPTATSEPAPEHAPASPAAPRLSAPPAPAPAATSPLAPSRLDLAAGVGTPSPTPRRRPLYKKWWFWTVTAAAAGVAVTAIAVGVTQGQPRETLLQVHAP